MFSRIKHQRLASVVEYLLALVFIWGDINVFFADTAVLPGIFALLVGQAAIYIYGSIFALAGISLLIAKVFKKKKLHKHALFVMSLSCIYVLTLAIAVSGVSWGLTTTVLTGVVSFVLWLRWTLATEYIDLKTLRQETIHMRD